MQQVRRREQARVAGRRYQERRLGAATRLPQDRRGDPEGIGGHQHAAHAERSGGVSRTTMLAFSALGNTDALGDDAGCHGPTSGWR
jgi:hypothetical protein